MAFEHCRYFGDRWQFAACTPRIPATEIDFSIFDCLAFPKVSKVLFDRPCPSCSEVFHLKGKKRGTLVLKKVFQWVEPELTSPFERIFPCINKLFVLLPSNLVHGLSQILAHMELVVDYFRIWACHAGRVH